VKDVRPDGGQLHVVLDGGEIPFDTVVLAIGFGLERGGAGHVAYWADSDGLDGIAADAKVLIAGYGDGGLADVLRVCVPDFRQADLVELVRRVPEFTCRKLIEWENALQGNIAELDRRYREDLEQAPDLIDRLQSPTAHPHVTITGRGFL